MPGAGVSVVIPVLNDATSLRRLLGDLRDFGDPALEVVVVDGGSEDDSASVASAAGRVVAAPRGRGIQLAAGADEANGDWVWFLHADTRVSAAAVVELVGRLDAPAWGFFGVRLDDGSWPYRMIERTMSWRSAASGIATGDQGIFVHRELLDAVGGVPRQPLLEDVELCRRLRRLAKPVLMSERLVASSRRWERHGVARTILLMWWLRFRYFVGADPATLARRYYG